MSEEYSDNSPELSIRDQIGLDLEIDAIVHHITPHQELERRGEAHGFRVVSRDESRPLRLVRFIEWLIDRHTNKK